MDSNYKVYKNGIGQFIAIDKFNIERVVNPADFWSGIRANNLKPGEFMNVGSNNYSTINNNTLSTIDFGSCTTKFNF